MIRIRHLLIAVGIGGLAACGSGQVRAPAQFTFHDVAASDSETVATIVGIPYETKLSGPSRGTRISAIDGNWFFKESEIDSGIPLVPGPHSVVISFVATTENFPVHFRIEAKPGATYVAKWETRKRNFFDLQLPDLVYIEDTRTGEIVTEKTAVTMNHTPNRYQPPSASGDAVATMRGTETREFLDFKAAGLQSVNGQRVHEEKRAEGAAKTVLNYTKSIAIAPGLQALGIGFLTGGHTDWIHPIMLDVQPGARYVVRFEHGIKQGADRKWQTFTIWIEDEADNNAIVIPKTDIPILKMFY